MNRKRRINLWTGLTLVLLVSLVLPWTAFAAVWTDKLDYSPGETVTILGDNSDGAGYIPGETVHVDVVGPNDYTAECDGVAADDSNAAWSCQVTLWDSDLAYGTYYYTATGLTSGVVEQGTFTDDLHLDVQSVEGTDCSGQTIDMFVPGETVCAFAHGLSKDKIVTIEWWAPHALTATRTVTFTASGNGDDKLELDDTVAELGTWTIKLYVQGVAKEPTVTFDVIPAVTIQSPADYAVFAITSPFEVAYTWTDPPNPPDNPDGSPHDTFVCTVNWGDGTEETPVGCETPQENIDHDYTDAGAGLYEITITVQDNHGGEGTASIIVVVYDPDAGFVTGGGWIDSPLGAYRQTPLEGRATFGFVSKYHKGANVPEGETEFQFHVANFSFHSDTYEWLVVNKDATNAQYKGVGTIDGRDGVYNFMLWATDGETDPEGTDTFRIKIWEGEDDPNPIYDNGFDQPIGEGGTIIIHTGQK